MKSKAKQPAHGAKAKKLYTFNVGCSFELQYTFTESQVEPDHESDEGAVEPTSEAIRELEKELTEYIGYNYPIAKVEAYAKSDDLLGFSEDLQSGPKSTTKLKKRKL